MSFLFGHKKSNVPQSASQPSYSGIPIQTSVYGKVLQIIYGKGRAAPNLIWYGDFKTTETTTTTSSGGGGGKGGVVRAVGDVVSGVVNAVGSVVGGVISAVGGVVGGGASQATSTSSTNTTYSASVALGICEGPISGIGTVWSGKNITTTSAQGFSVFTGTYPQSPWGYLVTNFNSQALGYNGLAYVAVSNYNLGTTANLPTWNFEVFGSLYNTGTNGDADPSQIVVDYLTNAHYGAVFPSTYVGDMTVYQEYCFAAGLFISAICDTQQSATGFLNDVAVATNSEWVWSSGTLNIVPYGDLTISGNGKTYTAPSTTQYSLNDNDFLRNNKGAFGNSSDPVTVKRMAPSDQVNSIKVEYFDSANNYNVAVAEVKDQGAIDLYGLRQAPAQSTKLFSNGTNATASAQLQIQRQAIRNIYQFTLDQRYVRLDPMDLVDITDTNLGLVNQWVRIIDIQENDDYSLTFTAEEYLNGTGNQPGYSHQAPSGYSVNYNSSPGNANTPIIFEPPVQLTTTGLETWLAVSGGSNWGGADIFISSDNITYSYAGRIIGNCRMGSSVGDFPIGNDPDVSNTLTVDLSESRGTLASGTQNDADQFHTLSRINTEIISYQTANLVGVNEYQLGTYLRRGVFGTTNADHPNGSSFVRLDTGIFKYGYDKSRIGSTVYFKILGFNIYGGGGQSLADVSAYTHVIAGPPVPPNVQNFNVIQNGNAVVFSWQDVVDSALEGYDVGYAPQGTSDWALFTMLTEAAKSTEMTNANVPPGTWTFGIRAIDIAGQLSAQVTTFDLIVTNQNSTITVQEQAPDYSGAASGFIRHWSGVLIPDDQNTASHYAGSSNFLHFVPTPVSSCKYTTPNFDTGYTNNFRIFESNSVVLGSGQSGSSNILPTTYIDAWPSGSTDPGTYNPWTIGSESFRYVNMQLQYVPVAGSVGVVKEFSFTIDTVPISETSPQTVTISSGGTTITYPTPFNTVPFVVPVVQSTAPLYATVTSVTKTTAVVNIFNSAGLSVGGSITYTATGS